MVVLGVTPSGRWDVLNMYAIDKPSPTDPAGIGSDIQQIRLLLEPFDPDFILCDVGDSGNLIAQLMSIYGNDKVYGCRYNSSPRSNQQFIPTWSEGNNQVKVDKLTENKKVISMLKEGELHYPKNQANRMLQEHVYHWQNVKIRMDEDELTGEFYEVITRTGDD